MTAPVRWSHLKFFAKSAAHYQAAVLATAKADTPAMRIGSATDAYLFQSAKVAMFDGTRRGQAWSAFQEDHVADVVVNRAENDAALRLAASISAHPLAMSLLEGDRRKELRWQYLGRDCSSHPDVMNRGRGFISDLKTGMTSDPNRFPYHALRLLYHTQLSFYGMAAEAAESWVPDDYFIVVAEQALPHVVTCFRLTDRTIQSGQKACRIWMEQLLNCERAGEFHGYAQGVMDLDVDNDDYELTFGEEPSADELLERV